MAKTITLKRTDVIEILVYLGVFKETALVKTHRTKAGKIYDKLYKKMFG
jgi:hypothetical protein